MLIVNNAKHSTLLKDMYVYMVKGIKYLQNAKVMRFIFRLYNGEKGKELHLDFPEDIFYFPIV